MVTRLPFLCWLFLCGCLLLATGLKGQSAEALKVKRQRLQRELKKTNQQLNATRARRGAAVDQAGLLRQQIEQRTELLATLRAEVDRSTRRLHRDSTVVVSLTDDLNRMAAEYGNILRTANRARLQRGWLVFLLSADGFNDAFRRLVYLRRYREYRRRQGVLIQRTRATLSERMATLEMQRQEQDSLLYAAEDQAGVLRQELKIQTNIVSQLSTSEKALLATIRRQQRQSERLNAEIQAAINRTLAKVKNREKTENRPSDRTVGSSIPRRKGRLAWPARGKVVRKFGTQPHPDVPSVKIQNTGIDIAAGPSATVEAVFAGEVISRRTIPGMNTVIMVKHGGYYTVYAGVMFARVSAGERVTAGQQLGLTPADGTPLHFEIWKGKTPLNPSSWLGQ